MALIAGLLALAVPAPALAATGSSQVVLYSTSGGQPTFQRTAAVSLTGELTVAFTGDSGCATLGVCGYSGWVAWQPPSHGQLMLLGSRRHGRTVWTGSLQLFGPPPQTQRGTNAAVQRAAATGTTTCLDSGPGGGSIDLTIRSGQISFDLAQAQPSLFGNRCAGPRDAQIVPLLPAPRLRLTALSHGPTALSLQTTAPFDAHGFAGRLSSTLELRIGRLGRTTSLASSPPEAGATRYRTLTLTFRARLGGSLTERYTGAANPVICGPLDACGASGTTTLTPTVTPGRAQLTLYRRATRHTVRFLGAAATGSGALTWSSGGGGELAQFAQGGTLCHDSALLGGGQLILVAGRGALQASYLPPGLWLEGGAIGTVCPGPDVGAFSPLATGKVPAVALRHRTLTIQLDTGEPFLDYGYGVTVHPRLTLTLTRVGEHSGTAELPAGIIP
ncbi:MAG: hypothetical protein ACRDMJ_08480 [Solirubrobacteraceae bacterium]